MKGMSWPLALVVSVALVVLFGLVIIGADTSDLILIIFILLGTGGGLAMGKIGQQTNGTNSALLAEITAHRQAQAELILALAGKRPAEIAAEPRSVAPAGEDKDAGP